MWRKNELSVPSILKKPNKNSQKKIVTFSEKPPQIRRITRLSTIIDLDFFPPKKKIFFNSDNTLPEITLSETEKTSVSPAKKKQSAFPRRKNAVISLLWLACEGCYDTLEYDNVKENLEKLICVSRVEIQIVQN